MSELLEARSCNWKTEYKRMGKDGKPITVKRRCEEMVNPKPALGGYIAGTCKRGHLNGWKD